MSATRPTPTVIPQRELRNNSGEILRRAEAGEEFIVTTNGKPVAKVTPIYLAPSATVTRIPARPAKRRGGFKELPLFEGGRPIMDILDEMREDRF